MKSKITLTILAISMIAALLLSACAAPATPTAAPVKVEPTVAPTVAKPCLIIGALYVGPVTDAGYNQAMHDGLMEVQKNIACVKTIEVENVYEGPAAETVMENMITQGATLIFPTSFGHQEPAFNVSKKHPDVFFEHAGGYMMSANFANFYGKPPETWYLMGVAAGKMTKSNKLGFVAALPLAWTLVFINSFELGAQSVNPKAETIVTYTYNWSDKAKEAAATDALIAQGVDVVTMHVDAPGTVIQTAEAKGVYSIGFQSLAAQKFAPKYWISGAGFTLGGKMTWFASSVMDKSWKPIFLRCGLADKCMAIAPFGPNVPQEVKDKVNSVMTDLVSGKLVLFTGPVVDQDGKIRVESGKALTDQEMNNVDWFVKGVVGSPKPS